MELNEPTYKQHLPVPYIEVILSMCKSLVIKTVPAVRRIVRVLDPPLRVSQLPACALALTKTLSRVAPRCAESVASLNQYQPQNQP